MEKPLDARTLSAELVLNTVIRTGPPVSGPRMQFNADWSMDLYDADGNLTFHTDPPSGDVPWLCSGCAMCDGEKFLP